MRLIAYVRMRPFFLLVFFSSFKSEYGIEANIETTQIITSLSKYIQLNLNEATKWNFFTFFAFVISLQRTKKSEKIIIHDISSFFFSSLNNNNNSTRCYWSLIFFCINVAILWGRFSFYSFVVVFYFLYWARTLAKWYLGVCYFWSIATLPLRYEIYKLAQHITAHLVTAIMWITI